MRLVDDWSIVVTAQPGPAFQLICFPHAGGDITAFMPLAAALEPQVELWAVRLPGRGGRFTDQMPSSFDALVDRLVTALGPHLRGPCGFYGQSFGAMLAFEVARRLPPERRPDVVVVASAVPPSRWPDEMADVADGPDRLLQLSGLAEVVSANPEVLPFVLRTIRADLTVGHSARYNSPPVVEMPLYAVVGRDDPVVTSQDMDGWLRHTEGEFQRYVVQGGHLLATAMTAGPVELLQRVAAPYLTSGWSKDVTDAY
jgi:surfactin synthase thioesterase subunit